MVITTHVNVEIARQMVIDLGTVQKNRFLKIYNKVTSKTRTKRYIQKP
jgi:hypothetical protein